MKMIESYALNAGAKIDKPNIFTQLFPLPFDRYITLHPSSGKTAKNWDYYNELIYFVLPELQKLGIQLVQIGEKDDQPLQGCFHTQGQTTINQAAYIVKNALLHIGNDSCFAHMAGAFETPLISLYGATTVANHAPHWFNKDKTILLESHRDGKKASCQFQEAPKTVNYIKIEEVIHAINSILGINIPMIKSISIGDRFLQGFIEVIPDGQIIHPQAFGGAPITIRYDYIDNKNEQLEQSIYANLQQRKCVILTDAPLNLDILKQLKPNIQQFVFEIKQGFSDLNWIKKLHVSGINYALITYMPEEELNKIKLDYIDYRLIIRQDKKKKESIKGHEKITKDTYFKCNKFILNGGKIYLCKSHWMKDLAISDLAQNCVQVGEFIDSMSFFEDADWFFFFDKA